MGEAEKSILMAAAIFGLGLGILLARDIFVQVTELQETIYQQGMWKRNVIVVTQREGSEYG